MKKYKEWLTNEIEIMESETSENYPHEQMVEREVVLNLINQLDEPEVKQLERKIKELESFNDELIRDNNQLRNELDNQEVLSQEWLEENKCSWMKLKTNGYYIPVEKLQNLLVTNKEKVIIPQFVAVYLDFAKSNTTLMQVLELANTRNEWEKWEKVYDWIEENHELFARAWLDGFTVEKEQKYYVLVRDEEYGGFWFLSKKNNGDISIGVNRNYSEVDWDTLKLTEQEIKDYDERYWSFAKKVEELEE